MLRLVIADAHAHVWTIDPVAYPWQPTFGFVPSDEAAPIDLLGAMDRRGVGHAILVQPSAYGSDHRFLLETVRAHPARFLAIGLVDPSNRDDTAAAARLVREQGLVGLRINLSLDLDTAAGQARGSGWEVLATLGVPLCVRTTPAHHRLFEDILRRHRDVRLVVDHLGLPEAGNLGPAQAWLSQLARFEHCLVKVAGLSRFSQMAPPYPDTWPLVRSALRSFGAARLVWGSDFPSGGVAEGYEGAVEAIESMPFLSAADHDQLLWATSRELWGMPREAPTP